MGVQESMNMKKIRVKFHHEDSGKCSTTFVTVGEEKHRCFNRLDSGGWYTVYPSGGYWESDCPVRPDVVFIVVDNDGKVLFEESNANLGAFQSVYNRARQMAKEWAEKLCLKTYDDWKTWLASDMDKHGYTGYVDNWLHAETGLLGTETIGSYEHLGIDFVIHNEKLDHIICGKEWRYISVYNMSNKNTEAICGFMYEECAL